MVHRATVGTAMVLAGTVIVAALLVAATMLASTLYSNATQPSVSGGLTITLAPSGPLLSAAYSNLGNSPSVLPPQFVPLLLVQGFPFSLGPAVLTGSVSGSAGTTAVNLSPPSAASSCKPGLSLSPPSRQGYISVGGAGVSGPATLSAVFEGSASWPSNGYGLLIGTNLSSLFVMQVAGTGNTTATVAYDSYNKSTGQITGILALSSPFGLDAAVSTELTLSLTGLGGFVVSVNGVPRLNGPIAQFAPGYSPLAVWATNATALLGLVTSVDHVTQWVGPTAGCGSFWVVPVYSGGSPVVTSNPDLLAVQVVGPVPGTVLPSGSLYVVEATLLGTPSPSTVELADCNPVSLGVNGTLVFSAPWMG
jgi:hypothetical protein